MRIIRPYTLFPLALEGPRSDSSSHQWTSTAPAIKASFRSALRCDCFHRVVDGVEHCCDFALIDHKTGKTVVRYQLTVDAGENPQTGRRQQVRRRYGTEKQARAALAEIT